MTTEPSFLFVCTGNICRSPLAELAMREEVRKRGLEIHIESAATGDWHLGYPPDPRAQAIAEREGFDISHYRSRKVQISDFTKFTHIIALDHTHYSTLKKMQPPSSKSHISLMLDYLRGREGQDVKDPYYGTDNDFEITWNDVKQACQALADKAL